MLVTVVLAACGGGADPTATSQPAAEPTATATATATAVAPAATATATATVPPSPTITPLPSPTVTPTPSPEPVDARHDIVFAGQFGDGPHRLYAVDADGANLHPLTAADWADYRRDIYEAFPAYSPNGKQVAFLRTGTTGGGVYVGGVYVVDVESQVEHLVVAGWARDIAWSPDSQQLAFTWLEWDWPPFEDGPVGPNLFKLVAVNVDGTNLRVLSETTFEGTGPTTDLFPHWSHDGQRILFARWMHAERADEDVIVPVVVDAGGGSEQVVDTGNLLVSGQIDWEPGSDAITFVGLDPESADPPGIYRLSLAGDNPERLTVASIAAMGEFAWSPGATTFAFTGLADWDADTLEFDPGAIDLYLGNMEGQDPTAVDARPLTIDVMPAWSGDGTRLAFMAMSDNPNIAEVELWVADTRGGESSMLARFTQRCDATCPPVWRPAPAPVSDVSGARHEIVFTGLVANGMSRLRLFAVDSDGSYLHDLTAVAPNALPQDGFYEHAPAYSPDGTRVAFFRRNPLDGAAALEGIYVINVETGEEQLVLPGYATNMAWSPDSARLAFTWCVGGRWPSDAGPGPCPTSKLVVVNPDGTDLVVLSERFYERPDGPATGTEAFGPAWSPDGSLLAFLRLHPRPDTTPNLVLVVVNPDGTGERELDASATSLLSGAIAWTPDGSGIAFAESSDSATPGIVVLGLDGSLTRLTPPSLLVSGKFAFSPDGSRLAFFARAGTDGLAHDLYVMDIEGGNLTVLDDSAQGYTPTPPAWSPDSTRLAYFSTHDGLSLRVVNVETGERSPTLAVSFLTEAVPGPIWRPSGD